MLGSQLTIEWGNSYNIIEVKFKVYKKYVLNRTRADFTIFHRI